MAKKAEGQLPDYTPFLVKYIEYARQLKPVLNEEAITMLEEFYINIKIKGFGSERVLPTLHKLIKAVARLKLKTIADEEDAKEVMEFYNVMLVDFQKSVVVSQSPRDLAYNECLLLLEQSKGSGGITLEEMVKQICESNEQLANYFEYPEKQLRIKNNRKMRNVCEMLLNHSNIKKIQERPIVLQWIDPIPPPTKTEESTITSITVTSAAEEQKTSDLCDLCDKGETLIQEKNIEEKIDESRLEQASHMSLESPNEEEDDDEKQFIKGFQLSAKGPFYRVTEEQYNSLIGNDEE